MNLLKYKDLENHVFFLTYKSLILSKKTQGKDLIFSFTILGVEFRRFYVTNQRTRRKMHMKDISEKNINP